MYMYSCQCGRAYIHAINCSMCIRERTFILALLLFRCSEFKPKIQFKPLFIASSSDESMRGTKRSVPALCKLVDTGRFFRYRDSEEIKSLMFDSVIMRTLCHCPVMFQFTVLQHLSYGCLHKETRDRRQQQICLQKPFLRYSKTHLCNVFLFK